MTQNWKKVAGLGLLALLFSGCAATPADPRAALEEKAAVVDATAQDLLATIVAAGLGEASARGMIDACQSEPAPGVAYRAGIEVKIGDDPTAGYEALVVQLDQDGWTETDGLGGTDPATPAGRFTRDDLTVDVKTGGFSSGGVIYGADAMTLGITIADDCVRVPDGGYIAQVEDLEKEILPRE